MRVCKTEQRHSDESAQHQKLGGDIVDSATPEVVQGASTKPVAEKALIDGMRSSQAAGQLFIGYPVMASPEGPVFIDALLVSPSHGLVCFDLVEGLSSGDYERRQDDHYVGLTARLIRHRDLVKNRELRIPLHTVTFAPVATDVTMANSPSLVNSSGLQEYLDEIIWEDAKSAVYKRTLSALQNITSIRRPSGSRRDAGRGPRAAKLERLENSIATLDRSQGTAVIETVEGVQRIRGLAGSGKTIVLALKAAYLHARHPDWRIAVTFHTRSLKSYFSRLINNFVLEQTGEEPDWNAIRVVNSWGAPGNVQRDGIYFEFCRTNNLKYYDFQAARTAFGYEEAFRGAVASALDEAELVSPLYDAILVDEAQDMPPEFLKLCHLLLKEPKRLVYAYDELQNLTHEGLPTATEIFGVDEDGRALVSFEQDDLETPQRDVILGICYRNPRPILVSAHALGFGIYREGSSDDTGLVQMFDRPELWIDVGYESHVGPIEGGKVVNLRRTNETSPIFLEDHSPLEDLIRFLAFSNESEQARWLAEQVKINLDVDGLKTSDIMIINTDPITARERLGKIRHALHQIGIASHIAGVDTQSDHFRQDDSVTCTGIHRAKGNEAAMVYVVNAQQSFEARANLAQLRNRLFTAITRSTAWLRVTGIGNQMESLIKEYDRISKAEFSLQFRYPTEGELQQLKVVHRDMTVEEIAGRDSGRDALDELIRKLSDGTLRVEDISNQNRQQLITLLESADELG